MTKEFIQYLNKIHKNLWEKTSDGELTADEIKKEIKKVAGYTVVDKYWEELHEFGRIEQIPETQKWMVNKPEKAGVEIDKDGRKRQKNVAVPENVLQAGEQYGVNFSAVFTEAIINEVSNIEQFVEDYLGDDYSEEEAEFIFEMIKKELHLKKGDRQQMARRGKRRRNIYTDIFDERTADNEHLENLRQKSFELQEMLEV